MAIVALRDYLLASVRFDDPIPQGAPMERPVKDAHLARMKVLAEQYLADADLLSESIETRSHGAYLLQLTAFEILLKAAALRYDVSVRRDHRYRQIFEALPLGTQQDLLARAKVRNGPLSGYARLTDLLDAYSKNFVGLRYSYEPYEGKTDDEVREVEARWVAAGAPLATADFAMHPEELFGLTEALRETLSQEPPG